MIGKWFRLRIWFLIKIVITMATFEIKTKHAMNVQGEYVDVGLSVQISSMFSNPFDDVDKIHMAFIRIHGIDLKPEGYLSLGYLEYEII
jgi:hypothetical protein